MSKRASLVRFGRAVGLTVVVGVLALTSGCIHVSQRAWDNGRAMTSSRQYQRVMSGDRSIGAFRGLYYRSNARMMSMRDVPYPLFGTDW